MPRILISYRREDSAAYAGRLADRLRDHFGRDNVFVDIDAIRPGEDFVEAIDRSLSSSTALVALIGKSWLDAHDTAGRRRLDGSEDFVRHEIAKALERHVRVIPTLVGNAVMPDAKDLPEDLQPLTRRQAIEISDSRFHQDVDRLIEALADAPSLPIGPATSTDASSDEGKTGSPRRWWMVGMLAVLAVALVGYWRLSTNPERLESSNRPPGGASTTTPATASTAPATATTAPEKGTAAPQDAATAASGPILTSASGEPVTEIEPNDDILHPNRLALGTTVRGEIRPVTDKDFFRIRTPAGGRRKIRVVVRNRSKLMPQIEIWDAAFNSVTSKYDVFGDLYLSFDAEPSADYFVECRFLTVNQNFADSNDSGGYDLTVLAESSPGRVTFLASSPILRGSTDKPTNEVEPNDDIIHPNVLDLGTTVRAEIRPVMDKDFFRIRTPPGRNELRIVVSNRSKLMPQVEVWDATFSSVASKYSVSGDVYLTFDPESSADYFVECRFLTVNRNFADLKDSGAYDLTVLSKPK